MLSAINFQFFLYGKPVEFHEVHEYCQAHLRSAEKASAFLQLMQYQLIACYNDQSVKELLVSFDSERQQNYIAIKMFKAFVFFQFDVSYCYVQEIKFV